LCVFYRPYRPFFVQRGFVMAKKCGLPDIRTIGPGGIIDNPDIRPGSAAVGRPAMDIPKRDRRGRPKGSKNKPKNVAVSAHTRDFPVSPPESPVPTVQPSAAPVAVSPLASGDLPVVAPVAGAGPASGAAAVTGGKKEDAIEAAEEKGEFKPAGLEMVVPVVIADPENSWLDTPPRAASVTESPFEAWRLL